MGIGEALGDELPIPRLPFPILVTNNPSTVLMRAIKEEGVLTGRLEVRPDWKFVPSPIRRLEPRRLLSTRKVPVLNLRGWSAADEWDWNERNRIHRLDQRTKALF
jgi:hypothetical protein